MNDAAKQRLLHLQYRARRAAEISNKLELLDSVSSSVLQLNVAGWSEALGSQLLLEVIRVGRTELIRQLSGELETFLTEPAPATDLPSQTPAPNL